MYGTGDRDPFWRASETGDRDPFLARVRVCSCSALDLLLISFPEARTRFAVFAHYYDLFPNVPGNVRIFPDISVCFRPFPDISGLFRNRNNAQKPQKRVSASSKNGSLSPVSLSQKPDKKQQKKGLTFLYRQRIIRFAVEETAKCAHSSTG